MQSFSFDFRDPVFTLAQWQISLQVITLENVYGLDPDRAILQEDGDTWSLACTGLRWAGQQEPAPGQVTLRARRGPGERLRVAIQAAVPHRIRAVKLMLRGLPPLAALDVFDDDIPVPPDGLLETYPNCRQLPLLLARRPDGALIGARSEDPRCRAKRFAIVQETMGPLAGTTTLECIHEEDACWFDTQIDVPDWVIDAGVEAESFRGEQLAYAEGVLGLVPWEERADVPAWAREIALCLTLHGMHWTGAIFNTYDQMLDAIRFVTDRIDGRHVLAYLPGWEGRYYWQYGDYRPEPRLGGADGFARLCAGARERGVHLMPMFGANCANAWHPDFHAYGPSSYMKSATRNVFHGNQPDWDTSRARDTGWQAWLNPGAPAWQTELVRQILRLLDGYQLDAVFLDTVEVWTNDPDFNLREGYRELVDRLRAGHPDLLVTGEDWWDGLLPIFPIFQRSARWRRVPEWVGRYARIIGHICDGDPSRGSAGVFEVGYAAYQPLPDRPLYIPTLAFVDGTLDGAQPAIEAEIERARERVR